MKTLVLTVIVALQCVCLSGSAVAGTLIDLAITKQVNGLCDKKQPAEAAQVYSCVAQQNPGTALAAEALQKAGRLCVKWCLYEQAETYFEAMKTMFGSESQQASSMAFEQGDAYTKRRHCQKAAEKFRYVLNNNPGPKHRLLAQGRLVLAISLAGDTANAQAEQDKLCAMFSACDADEKVDGTKLEEIIYDMSKKCTWVGKPDLAAKLCEYNADRFCGARRSERKSAYLSEKILLDYYQDDPSKIEARLAQWQQKCTDPNDLSYWLCVGANKLKASNPVRFVAMHRENVECYQSLGTAKDSRSGLIKPGFPK